MRSLTVMTWNVENLFLPDPRAQGERDAAFHRKILDLAALIDRERPDVLALQEVGGEDALAVLQKALNVPMPHALCGEPDGRGSRVAFLTRLPITDAADIVSYPRLIRPVQARDELFDDVRTAEDESLCEEMSRGALEVTVDADGMAVTLVNVHFKSKLPSYPRRQGLVQGSPFEPKDEGERCRYAAYAMYRRTAEAVTIRECVNEILAPAGGSFEPQDGLGREKAVIVCGTLNDTPDAASTQILQGPAGCELGSVMPSGGDRGDGYRLWNLAPLLNRGPAGEPPAEPPCTRVFRGRGELIDHVLASHRLTRGERRPSARTTAVCEALPSVGENPTDRAGATAPDHAAVVARFVP